MNDSKYRYILYIIIVVIISTIGIQAYWNYKNYLSSKQQLINDVQLSLDKAVDDYYANLAKRTTFGLSLEGKQQKNAFGENSELQKILDQIDEKGNEFSNLDSLDLSTTEGITVIRGLEANTIIQNDKHGEKSITPEEFKKRIQEIKATRTSDSASFDIQNIEMLTKKIVISITNDSLDIKHVDSLLKVDLKRKNIDLEYTLVYNNQHTDSLHLNSIHYSKSHEHLSQDKMVLSSVSKSAFLPKDSLLTIVYGNTTWVVLQRIIWGIVISSLLVLAVISCLFYLLKIIKHQKQLAEVKNDLISNITHEFKTPIATIGVALESIQNFNAIDDKEKAKSYLDMSRAQLSKLNTMVEKLLETASLDSEHLELNSDRYNISEVIISIAEKHKLQNSAKTITYSVADNVYANVDIFHFENAINNIIDNAFKYGGDAILIDLKTNASLIEIAISDNGNSLSKADKERIFEKFYRVPKGNTHDVKGFGIGLYYAKKIIEKHNGTINVELKNGLTTFKIYLPNA
jgi:signal transduction histidine kinase